MGKCTQARKRQTGKSQMKKDKPRKALKPGWRSSSKGKKYFENRKNRSDLKGSGAP